MIFGVETYFDKKKWQSFFILYILFNSKLSLRYDLLKYEITKP